MMRIRTLDAAKQAGGSPEQLQHTLEPLCHTEIDVLCCQAVHHAKDSALDTCSLVARTLNMSCGNFAAHRRLSANQEISGLALYTGPGVWILNSGSFPVTAGNDTPEEMVQFGLIRKNGASVLVLNLQLAANKEAVGQQLRSVFGHPLLRDPYGAVVLCADRPVELPAKELQGIVARSNYSLAGSLVASAPEEGLLCLLTARSEAVMAVSISPADASDESPASLPGLSLEFELKRVANDRKNRPFFPLSFREQWLGYKEHRAFA